jgi:hypothetical protein
MIKPLLFLIVLIPLACDAGSGGGARDNDLTQREQDSILAQSRIPGATGVGKAMRVADSASARIQAADNVDQ